MTRSSVSVVLFSLAPEREREREQKTTVAEEQSAPQLDKKRVAWSSHKNK